MHEKTIAYWAKKYKIKRIVTWQDINKAYGEEIEIMYVAENKSIEDIYQKYGYVFKTIKKILGFRGVTLRSQGETVKLSALTRERKHSLNENYFNSWTSEMAYIVGFINADGNIIYDEQNGDYVLQIAIKEDDEDVLEKIRVALEYEGELGYYNVKRPNGNSTDVVKLTINSKKMVKSLMDIGIEERKSLVKGVPSTLPEKYIFDYVRGYFDGNGTIDMRYDRTIVPALRIRLSSGSEKHLGELQNLLVPHGFTKKKLEKAKSGESYSLRFNNKEVHILHKEFYKNSSSIHMARKKEKFDKCVNKRIFDKEEKRKNFKRERGVKQTRKEYF